MTREHGDNYTNNNMAAFGRCVVLDVVAAVAFLSVVQSVHGKPIPYCLRYTHLDDWSIDLLLAGWLVGWKVQDSSQ